MEPICMQNPQTLQIWIFHALLGISDLKTIVLITKWVYWVFIMSGTMLSTLHTFPPEERHHNISMGRHSILILYKENKALRGCTAELLWHRAIWTAWETKSFGRRIVQIRCTENTLQRLWLVLRNVTCMWSSLGESSLWGTKTQP